MAHPEQAPQFLYRITPTRQEMRVTTPGALQSFSTKLARSTQDCAFLSLLSHDFHL